MKRRSRSLAQENRALGCISVSRAPQNPSSPRALWWGQGIDTKKLVYAGTISAVARRPDASSAAARPKHTVTSPPRGPGLGEEALRNAASVRRARGVALRRRGQRHLEHSSTTQHQGWLRAEHREPGSGNILFARNLRSADMPFDANVARGSTRGHGLVCPPPKSRQSCEQSAPISRMAGN